MKPKLSVVICTFNRGARLKDCLESLTKQNFSDFEVIIIDGGSTDNTHQILSRYSRQLKIKKFIFEEKQLSKVRDLGWRKAKGKYISWIDDDVIVSKNWAKNIIKILDNHRKIGGVSGPTIVKKAFLKNRDVFFFYKTKGIYGFLGKIWSQFFLEGQKYEVGRLLKSGAWTPGSNFPSSLKIKGLKDVDYLEACNMTLRKRLIAQVGGFDYGYTGVGEWSELDLAIRIKNLGYRLVFSSKVRVNHNISQGGVYSRRTHAKQRMENFFKFYFRHIFKPQPDYFFKFLAYLLFLNSYWTYKAISTKNINWLGGWIGTVTGLKLAPKEYHHRHSEFISES
jgi:glycosyltransferase involved in cell wall biosynthesis